MPVAPLVPAVPTLDPGAAPSDHQPPAPSSAPTTPTTPNRRLAAAGLWLPLVTPFGADGRPDLPALAALVRHLAAQGATGFVACGSTGEAAMLSAAEQQAVVATTLAAAQGRPVLAGLHGVRPEAVAAQAAEAADLARQWPGLAGLLLTAPAYVRPAQAGIVRFFHQVAEASPLPLVVYDIPARTGVRIHPDTLLALAEHPRIQAVKDCSGDRAAAEVVLNDGRLALLCGNDDELFDQLARGAAGAISAAAHVGTAHFAALVQDMSQGRLHAARARWQPLAPLVRALFAEPNPGVIKAVLAHQGHLLPLLREPMLPASAPALAAALRCLACLDDDPALAAGQSVLSPR